MTAKKVRPAYPAEAEAEIPATAAQPAPELVYRPMAVQEPSPVERLEALELRMAEMEKAVTQHNRYHFGRPT